MQGVHIDPLRRNRDKAAAATFIMTFSIVSSITIINILPLISTSIKRAERAQIIIGIIKSLHIVIAFPYHSQIQVMFLLPELMTGFFGFRVVY